MTPEEIADSICKWKNTGLRQSVIDAITDAVAAEREACANIEPGMDTSNVLGWETMTPDERRMWKAGYSCAMDDYVCAIRARGQSS